MATNNKFGFKKLGIDNYPTWRKHIHSFIHVTPVAEAHLSNASPFQTPLITPNNKLIKPTNKDNFLPG
jgi:hypothetical protein